MSQQPMTRIMQLVGNRSRYQLIMLIYFTLLWVEITYMLLGSPYIFMNPVFRCNSFDEEVTEADACDIIDECQLVNDFSLTSYAGLYCEQQTERNFIQSAIYIGSILGLFVMNPLADIKGRRFVFIAAQTVANVGVAILITGAYTKSVPAMVFAQIFIGFGAYATMIVGYIHISDMCEDKLRQYGIMFMNGVWAIAQISFFFLYNWYNYWYNFLIVLVFIPNIGLLLFSLFFIVETPPFLMNKKNDKDACMAVMNTLAMYNQTDKASMLQIEFILRELHKQNASKQEPPKQILLQFVSICKQPSLLKIILLVAIIEISTNAYYYGVQFSLAEVGTNFGNNIMLTGIIEAIGFFSSTFFITKLKRRLGMLIFNLIAIVLGLSFLLPFISSSRIAATILLGACRFVNTYSQAIVPMMQVESFPSEYQSTGWGMIEGTSQLGNFLSPFIVSGAINLGINPLIIFSVILAVLGLAPLKFLKETLKSRPQDALLQNTQHLLEQDADDSFENRGPGGERLSVN